VEHELSNEQIAEPILPQVPWKVVTIVMLVLAAVVPAGAYLGQSGRLSRLIPKRSNPGPP
jgi:hypothetical protein